MKLYVGDGVLDVPEGPRAIPHNSKCRYGERGAADAKPKAQIILDAAKVSAASGGNSEPKQGQRSQSARGFCPRSTMRVPQPDIIEHFGNADAVPQMPERCLSRKAGIVRCCHNAKKGNAPDSQGAFPFYFLTYPFMRFTAVPSQTGTEWLRCRGGRAGRWYPGNRDGWGHQGNPGFPGRRRNTGRKMRHPCRRWRT